MPTARAAAHNRERAMSERDAMVCRACGREERASEGYPCQGCGTFICNMCELKGIVLCRDCAAKGPPHAGDSAPATAKS